MTGLTSAASSPRLLNGVVPARTAHTLGNDEDWGGQAYDTIRNAAAPASRGYQRPFRPRQRGVRWPRMPWPCRNGLKTSTDPLVFPIRGGVVIDPTRPDTGQWALVFAMRPITEKEVRHLRITADRLRALTPDLTWAESRWTDMSYQHRSERHIGPAAQAVLAIGRLEPHPSLGHPRGKHRPDRRLRHVSAGARAARSNDST